MREIENCLLLEVSRRTLQGVAETFGKVLCEGGKLRCKTGRYHLADAISNGLIMRLRGRTLLAFDCYLRYKKLGWPCSIE